MALKEGYPHNLLSRDIPLIFTYIPGLIFND